MAVTKEYAVFFSLFPNNNKGVNVRKKKEEDCFWIISTMQVLRDHSFL